MSASKEKRVRQQLRDEGMDPRLEAEQKAAKKAKHDKRVRTIIVIIALVLIVAIFCVNSNLFYSNFSAVTIGDTEYTASEFSYYYNMELQNMAAQYGEYFSMIVDPTKPLSRQAYNEEQSWEDFLKESALNTMTNITMLNDEAQEAGFTLDEEQQSELDVMQENLKTVYLTANFADADTYFSANFGKGLDVETVQKLDERAYIGAMYSASISEGFTYTDAELSAQYKKDAANYDVYNFVSGFVPGVANEEEGIDEATAMATAKEQADSIIAETAEDIEDFQATVLDVTGTESIASRTQGSSLSDTYSDWMKDPVRKQGDTTVLETDGGYYALYFDSTSDNDYDTVDVRHILINATKEEDGSYTQESKDAAKASAESLLQQWEDGDATEGSFEDIAEMNSMDGGSNQNGGLYENVAEGQMVTEFNDWIYDDSRKVGDTDIVFNEDANYCGYHVMYFSGEGENQRDSLAENTLRSDEYTAWETENLADYTVIIGFTAGLVG